VSPPVEEENWVYNAPTQYNALDADGAVYELATQHAGTQVRTVRRSVLAL
jgi:hypothetical protein